MRILASLSLLLLPFACVFGASDLFMDRVQSKGFFGKNIGYMAFRHKDNYAYPVTLSTGEKAIISGSTDLIHAGMNHLVLIRFNNSDHSYYIDKTSKFFPGYFNDLKLFHIVQEGKTEQRLFAINAVDTHLSEGTVDDGSLMEFDIETLKLKNTFKVNDPGYAVYFESLHFSDIDNDGKEDLILQSGLTIWVLDPNDWNNYRKIDDLTSGFREFKDTTSTFFTLGDADNDGQNEIIFSDGSTFSLGKNDKAIFKGKFPVDPVLNERRIVIEDIDGDQQNEVLFQDVTDSPADTINIFNGKDFSAKLSIKTGLNTLSFILHDIEGDGQKELFLTHLYGGVRSYDTATGSLIFEYVDNDSGGSGMIIEDLDGDGQRELLFGEGQNSSARYRYLVYDLITHEKKWESREANPPYRVISHESTSNELVVSSASRDGSNFKVGYVFVLDSETLREKHRFDLEEIFADEYVASTGSDAALFDDLDNDGNNELIVTRTATYEGTKVAIIDPQTSELLHDHTLEPFVQVIPNNETFPISLLKAQDINNDGVKEFLLGTHRIGTSAGSPGFFIQDSQSGEILYQFNTGSSPTTFDSVYDVELLPSKDGKQPEIFFLTSGALYKISNLNTAPQLLVNGGISAIAPVSIDGSAQLLAGSSDGYLYRIDLENNEIEQLAQICTRKRHAEEERDLVDDLIPIFSDQTETGKILFTCRESIGVYDLKTNHSDWTTTTDKYITLSPAAYRLREGKFSFFFGSITGVDVYTDFDPDNDGLGNLLDSDDDGDGYLDIVDDYPLDGSRWKLEDFDADGLSDEVDPDDDNDGVNDDQDTFPKDATESVDSDDDGIGNNADEDDDNDGMDDEWELSYGLDPLNPADASGDPDGDGASNLSEYQANTDPLSAPPPPAKVPDQESSGSQKGSGGAINWPLLILLALLYGSRRQFFAQRAG
ncbi:GlyGly-CTERM sorting domain-containing protein [Microbulbifer bruguierae]|uniref:GlyGly-CTERM sorting domain-containing protein n=1 Tax=Microbulbifer bruguierae TaxID=3029061 RepID=A0ABY8NA91_9GAMM|nr:GlyGly-CTERM sorting domain-containing protein [Microbulbifer bruguierae]WGL15349.1 GlyGly-CTERM sorting domain-containing protein [Microbulbifer bruguierae]